MATSVGVAWLCGVHSSDPALYTEPSSTERTCYVRRTYGRHFCLSKSLYYICPILCAAMCVSTASQSVSRLFDKGLSTCRVPRVFFGQCHNLRCEMLSEQVFVSTHSVFLCGKCLQLLPNLIKHSALSIIFTLLPGKHLCTALQGVNVAASIQTYLTCIPGKRPCGPK